MFNRCFQLNDSIDKPTCASICGKIRSHCNWYVQVKWKKSLSKFLGTVGKKIGIVQHVQRSCCVICWVFRIGAHHWRKINWTDGITSFIHINRQFIIDSLLGFCLFFLSILSVFSSRQKRNLSPPIAIIAQHPQEKTKHGSCLKGNDIGASKIIAIFSHFLRQVVVLREKKKRNFFLLTYCLCFYLYTSSAVGRQNTENRKGQHVRIWVQNKALGRPLNSKVVLFWNGNSPLVVCHVGRRIKIKREKVGQNNGNHCLFSFKELSAYAGLLGQSSCCLRRSRLHYFQCWLDSSLTVVSSIARRKCWKSSNAYQTFLKVVTRRLVGIIFSSLCVYLLINSIDVIKHR